MKVNLLKVLLNKSLKSIYETAHENQLPVCVYHDNCLDGIFSAWVVNEYFEGQVKLVPGDYNDSDLDINQFKGRDVYLVDFSFSREVTLKIKEVAKSLTVLDHHVSAKRNIGDLFHIDSSRAGCLLTWEHFFPITTPPKQLLLVNDRDLWKFEYPETKDFVAYAFANELTVRNVDKLINEVSITEACKVGKVLNRRQQIEVNKLKKNTFMMTIDDVEVPVVNAGYEYASELGNQLSVGHPFAVVYQDLPNGRRFSLRSQKDTTDVSLVAKKFGGGGHKEAAGFMLDWVHLSVNDFNLQSKDL